jgi:hypothetical protein
MPDVATSGDDFGLNAGHLVHVVDPRRPIDQQVDLRRIEAGDFEVEGEVQDC